MNVTEDSFALGSSFIERSMPSGRGIFEENNLVSERKLILLFFKVFEFQLNEKRSQIAAECSEEFVQRSKEIEQEKNNELAVSFILIDF